MSANTPQYRVQVYSQAQRAYERYTAELGVSGHELSASHYSQAAASDVLTAAEAAAQEAVLLTREAGRWRDHYFATHLLGMILQTRGQFRAARECLHETLEWASAHVSPTEDIQGLISGCHYYLGVVADRMGDSTSSIEHYRASQRIDEFLGDFANAGRTRDALVRASAKQQTPKPGNPYAALLSAERDHRRSTPAAGDTGRSPLRSWTPHPGSRPVVWVVSYSPLTNASVVSFLEQAARSLPDSLNIVQVVLETSRNIDETTPTLEREDQLVGLVVILDKLSLSISAIRQWIDWGITRAVDWPDFRLFLRLLDLRPNDLRSMHSDALIARLIQHVQLPTKGDDDDLLSGLGAHLKSAHAARRIVAYRSGREYGAFVIRTVTRLLQAACAVVVILIAAAAYIDLPSALGFLRWPMLTALAIGAVVVPSTSIPLFYVLRGFRFSANAVRLDPRVGRWVFWGLIAQLVASAAAQTAAVSNGYLALGIVAGFMLDTIRRHCDHETSRRLDIQRLLNHGAKIDGRGLIPYSSQSPLAMPYAPPLAPVAFVSYAVAQAADSETAAPGGQSRWSADTAHKLRQDLERINIRTFHSGHSIAAGSDWRLHLKAFLERADVLLVTLDSISIGRSWVATEVLASLMRRRRSVSPAVVVLVDPALARSSPESVLPVFRDLLHHCNETDPDRYPRIPIGTPAGCQGAIDGIQQLRPLSIFPAPMLRFFWIAVTPVLALGTLAGLVGLIAAVGWLFQRWEIYDSLAALQKTGAVSPLTVAIGLFAGLAARLSIAAGSQVVSEHSSGAYKVHRFATVALGMCLFELLPLTPDLWRAWAIVAVPCGWFLAAGFVQGVARGDARRVLD